ncbi:MAG TPA: FtsX-like permease family protein [Acidimicrobiales bacterium]
MNLATREMRRQPRPFLLLTGGLTVVAVLLAVLGGLAQGLIDGFSGVLRAPDADLVVYARTANDSVVRSRVTAEQRDAVAGVDGVESVGGLGISLVGARPADGGDALDVAVVGYDERLTTVPAPPEPGQAYADEALRDDGVETGDVLEVGPAGRTLEVVGFVSDTRYLLNPGLWVEPGTWRAVQAEARPDAAPPAGGFQVLTVRAEPGVDTGTLAARIDAATGATRTLTRAAAIDAIPGLTASSGTLDAVGYLVLVVALLVAALFFSLVVVERLPLYAVLKALGAPTRRLFAGVATQAAACAALAAVVGGLAGVGLAAASPPGVPMALPAGRLAGLLVALVVAAVAGAVTALRRIHRVDPATAIGTGT